MRFKIITVCIFILIISLCWIIFCPPRIQGRSLDINIINLNSRYLTNQIVVRINNVSKNTVTFDVGRTICVAFLHDGRWETNDVGHFFIEEIYLWPGFSYQFTNYTKIPMGTKEVKVGVSYINLTWRGLYALKVTEKGKFSRIGELLGGLDRSKRSLTEWSETVPLHDALAVKGF